MRREFGGTGMCRARTFQVAPDPLSRAPAGARLLVPLWHWQFLSAMLAIMYSRQSGASILQPWYRPVLGS
jgi:hypothetical protein